MKEYIMEAGIYRLAIQVYAKSVTIQNSSYVDNRELQTEICKAIKQLPDLPSCIEKRPYWSLRNEWRAHNRLYRLPLLPKGWRDRLKVVDLDAEPLWRRIAYAVISIF